MGPPEPGKEKYQHSFSWDPDYERDVWRPLRRLAFDEGTNATAIVKELMRDFVNRPPADQAATLRKVRAAGEEEDR